MQKQYEGGLCPSCRTCNFRISFCIISFLFWWPSVIWFCSWSRWFKDLNPIIGTGIIFSLSGFSKLACFQITGSMAAKMDNKEHFLQVSLPGGVAIIFLISSLVKALLTITSSNPMEVVNWFFIFWKYVYNIDSWFLAISPVGWVLDKVSKIKLVLNCHLVSLLLHTLLLQIDLHLVFEHFQLQVSFGHYFLVQFEWQL